MAFVDSPRTEAASATFLENGAAIDDISVEMSFHSPKKRRNDLVLQMRTNGHGKLRTPGSRNVLTERVNLAGPRRSGEFTPLLKSATRKATSRGKENTLVPQTPAFSKQAYASQTSPDLRPPESSGTFHSDLDSDGATGFAQQQLPAIASSSGQSTPVAGLPTANAGRLLDEQRNLMTLREQENIISRTEKENFGLKLKIHFLEDLLNKSDPNLNHKALKENTDLRVDRATLQRDLAKVKKQLGASARDAEELRRQLLADTTRAEQQLAEKTVENELRTLRASLEGKQGEIEDLREVLAASERDEEVGELKETIDDLEATLRDKDRIIEDLKDKEEELEQQKQTVHELAEKLRQADHRTDKQSDLQVQVEMLEVEVRNSRAESQELREKHGQVLRDRDNALRQMHETEQKFALTGSDLEKVNVELETRSRNAEHMVKKLERELESARVSFEDSHRKIERLELAIDDSRLEADAQQNALRNELNLLRNERSNLSEALTTSEKRLAEVSAQLQAMSNERDVLQNRHNALTLESESLQKELSDRQSDLVQLRAELERQSLHSIQLRQQNQDQDELNKANSNEIVHLHDQLASERQDFADQKRSWNLVRAEMQQKVESTEKRLVDLQTVASGQEDPGSRQPTHAARNEQTINPRRESDQAKLEQALRRTSLLESEVAGKTSEKRHLENQLSKAKKEISERLRDQEIAREKVQALEDDIEVLQGAIEENSDRSREELAISKRCADDQKKQAEADFEAAEARIKSLQEECQAAGKQKAQLQTELDKVRAELSLSRQSGQEDARIQGHSPNDPGKLGGLRSVYDDKVQSLQADRLTLQTAHKQAERTVAQLREHIHSLENDVIALQTSQDADQEMIMERQDLHGMIKSAKLEAEELQCQVKEHERRALTASEREQKLRVDVERLELERNELRGQSSALTKELDMLQARYRGRLDELHEQHELMKQTQRSCNGRAVKASTGDLAISGTSHGASESTTTVSKKHAAELRGLAKQIEYLRAKLKREQNFRDSLIYEKRYLMMQIEMFKACNTADLCLLKDMGATTKEPPQRKYPSLRAVSCLIVATVRMRQMQTDWAAKRRTGRELGKKVEQLKASTRPVLKSRRCDVHKA